MIRPRWRTLAPLLLLAAPALANVGRFSRLGVEGGAVLGTGEIPEVRIAEELLWLRPAPTSDRRLTGVQWAVAYHVEATEPRRIDVAFPLELTLFHVDTYPGAKDAEALTFALSRLEANDPSWAPLAARARELMAKDDGYAFYSFAFTDLAVEVAQRAPGRFTVPAGELSGLGVEQLSILHQSRPVVLGDALVEMRAATEKPSKDAHMPAMSPVLHLTVHLPFSLSFVRGPSQLTLRWRSPVGSQGAWSFDHWHTSYWLGPGRSWAGPIGRFFLVMDRMLLRGADAPELPMPTRTWALPDAVVWEAESVEPAPDDHLHFGGTATWGMDGAGQPPDYFGRADWSQPWTRGQAPGLSIGEPSATSTVTSPNRIPEVGDGIFATELGFGAANLTDGGMVAGWCGRAEGVSVRWTLEAPTKGLRVHGGNRNPWFLGDCAEDEEPVSFLEDPDAPRRCFHRRAEPLSTSWGRPLSATLLDASGAALATLSFGEDGLGESALALPAGTYTLRIDAATPGARGLQGTVCVAEIEAIPQTTPEFDALYAVLE